MGKNTIVFGVTADVSVALLGKVPALLAERGWDVHVVSSPGQNLSKLRASGRITCHPIKMSRNPSFFTDLYALLMWIRTLLRVRPQVVSVGTPKAALLGMLSAAAIGVNHRVYILRGLRLETERGLSRLVLWWAEWVVSRLASEIIAVSKSLREVYLSEKLSRPSKVRVLGLGASMGVDLSLFRPASANEIPKLRNLAISKGLNPETPTIGFVGRQHPDKGIGMLAAAVKAEPLSNLDFQLLVIGVDESDGLLNKALLSSSKVRVFLDQCSHKDLAELYRLMAVLCLPSQREGLPNVVLEALASEVPVVVAGATGSVDAVGAGLNALVVDKYSPIQLSVALAAIISDENLSQSLSSHAREWVRTRFAVDLVSTRYVSYYQDLLKGG